ncbi:MAG: hypothetical protein RR555_06900 [Bacteroidales bacterium]
MKKLLLFTFMLAALPACNNNTKKSADQEPQYVSGVVFDATMNTITIVNGTDTLCFSTENAQKEYVNNIWTIITLSPDSLIVSAKEVVIAG